MAETEFVVGLDDDSVLQSPGTIEQTLAEFDQECIGAVAIPYINILESDKLHHESPDDDSVYVVHAFEGAAWAIRRSVFLEAGSFRELFFYMGEESDLCIRLVDRGIYVRLGRAEPIYHFRPPNRVSPKVDILERRNDVISFYLNTPSPLLLPYITATFFRGLVHGIRVGRVTNMARGLMQGFRFILAEHRLRSPVSLAGFIRYRKIKRRGALLLSELLDDPAPEPKAEVFIR